MSTMVNQRIQGNPKLITWTKEARKDVKNVKSKDLINRLPRLLNKGLIEHKNKQTKEAYVLLTRYLHFVDQLQKRRLDTEERREFNAALKIDEVKAVQEAIIASLNTNILSANSIPHQSHNNAADNKNVRLKTDTIDKFDIDDALNLPEIPTDEPVAEKQILNNFITCTELYPIIQKETRYLIIDVRPTEHYQHSRIKSEKCINIPQCEIVTGKIASKFEGYLRDKDPVHAKLYSERSQTYVDLIVLVDWETCQSTLLSHMPIAIMKNILTIWDPRTVPSRHVILDGGYTEWLNVYPTFTTNPTVLKPIPMDNTLDEILDDFSYPDWIDHDSTNTTHINYSSKNNNNEISKSRNLDMPGLHIRINEPINNERPAKLNMPIKKHSSFDDEDVDMAVHLPQQIDKINLDKGSSKTIRPIVDRTNKPVTLALNPQFIKLIELITTITDDFKAQVKLEEQSLEIENNILFRLTTNSNNVNYDDDDDDLDSMYHKRDTVQNTISAILQETKSKEIQISEINANSINMTENETRQQLKCEIDMSTIKHRLQHTIRQRKETQQKIDEAEKKREEARVKGSPKHDDDAVYKEPLKSENSTTNSGLKRSISSPNLAKMDDKKVPVIDRSSKPRAVRRNVRETNNNIFVTSWKDSLKRMDPVYRNCHPGITGLKNLGNSCYMNSIIQCLSNTSYLARYFIDNGYQDDLNTNSDNETQGQIAEEFAHVIKALWRGQYKSIAPRDLKDTIGQYRLQFDSCEQQDSHEFLTFLLEWMHNDLRKDSKMRIDGILSAAEKEWEKALKGQYSIISRLFMGQLRSTICCTTCSGKSITYETFTSLSISLPDANRCTLDECIKHFLSGQRISGWNCPHCKTAREATKKFDFVKLAPIIIIHLNRFAGTDVGLEKKNTMVLFPVNDLNLKQYLVVDADSNTLNHAHSYSYNLYGLSNHYGSMGGGHYTAFCKNAALNKWYKYDDHSVSEINEQNVRSQNSYAYLLFYTSFPYESYTFIDDSS